MFFAGTVAHVTECRLQLSVRFVASPHRTCVQLLAVDAKGVGDILAGDVQSLYEEPVATQRERRQDV